MNKSLLFLLSLTCLPCFGNQIQLLLDLKTTDNQARQIMGSYNPETNRITSFSAEAAGAASLFIAMGKAHLIDTTINDSNGQPVTIKKVDQEIPISTDAATFDLLQEIMADKKDVANLDQPTTVKLLNTLGYANAPAVLCDQLVSHCVDLFIAHPEQRCPFGTITAGDDSNNPSLFIQNVSLIETARNTLYNHFKTNVLPLGPGWQIVRTFDRPSSAEWSHDGEKIATRLLEQRQPDGQEIVTHPGSHDVCIWDINGMLLQTLAHPETVRLVIFSPDGQQVLTACDGNSVRLWNINGNLLHILAHPRRVDSATYSPDGQQVLTACVDHNVRIWDLDGTLLQALPHPDWVGSATYSPNGQQVLTACEDYNAHIWNLDGTLLQALPHPSRVWSATYSPDGHHVLTACEDGNARIWNLDGTLLQALPQLGRVWSAIYSPHGQHVLTTCEGGNAHIWNLDGTLLQTLTHPDQIGSVTYSPDSQRILTTCGDTNARIWNTSGNVLQTLAHPKHLLCAKYSPDGQRILTICADYIVRIWQMAWVPQFRSILDLSEAELRRLAFLVRVATNPRFTAQEIANLLPLYRNLPVDQRVWVNQQTNYTFTGLFWGTLDRVSAIMKNIFKK